MKITDTQLKEIYAHAREIYPYECCGFLVGDLEEGGLVRRIRRATNQNQERTDRFIISAEEFAQVQLAADEIGQEIIGVYHSHPDWPAIPSQTDMESAWEEVFYLIVSIHEKMPLNTRLWRLADEGLRRFEEAALEIVDANELQHEA